MPQLVNRRERLVLLGLLLVFLVAAKVAFDPGLGRNSLDGDFYYQVARHVAEGDGLLTSVSLYHQGLEPLPHPTPIYPLWPLLLGAVGAVVGLPTAAAVLPEVFAVVSLLLLYALANRLAVRLGHDGFVVPGGGALDFGHLAVLLLGTNPVFFEFTSLPYTEALAFTCLFASLLILDHALDADSLAPFALAGVAAGAALMTRSQAVMLLVAVPALLLAGGLRRRRLLAAVLVFVLFAGAVLLPWVAWVASFVEEPTPRTFLSVGAYRHIPDLEPFQWRVPAASRWEALTNRLGGVVAAFDPRADSSYVASFGLVAWAVPLALLALLFRPSDLRGVAPAAFRSEVLTATIALVTGLLMVAPLHLLHSRFLWEWRFGHRHGLPLLLVVLVALIYLLRRGGPLRALALALAGVSVLTGAVGVARLLTFHYPAGPVGAERELVAWLAAHPAPPTVITTNAQPLAVHSRARFHWMECREPAGKTRILFERAAADYLLVYPHEAGCSFFRGMADLEVARMFEDERGRIFALAPRSAAPTPQP